jgi:hypothetical protein
MGRGALDHGAVMIPAPDFYLVSCYDVVDRNSCCGDFSKEVVAAYRTREEAETHAEAANALLRSGAMTPEDVRVLDPLRWCLRRHVSAIYDTGAEYTVSEFRFGSLQDIVGVQ